MAIPQSFLDELLARTDVVELVGRYVPLKKSGANFMGLCPFHGEKSPSFSVNPAKQFYHCFGCGKSGNALKFLMEHAGMGFVEAVKDLSLQFGMQIPEDEASPEDRARANEQRQKQTTLTEVLEKAGESYRRHLKNSPRAVAYFKGRGLSGPIAKQFGLGYAPQGWHGLASVFPHYDDPLLVESGLVILNTEEGNTEERRYDRFRDRVMFPIRNVKGECIGFGGRVLGDDKPKYLNSPETPVFSKGRELYGLFEARNALHERGYALVTEGYMDVVALAQLGFPNAVATLGTACTPDHIHKLFRFTNAIVFSFDGDAAGRRAARKALDAALPYASDVRSIKFLFLPTEHDPDSFIRAHGAEAFSEYIKKATPLSRFLIEAAQEGCDLNTAEGRAHMASNAKPLWLTLPQGVLREQLLTDLATQAQLGAERLLDLWTAPPASRSATGNVLATDDTATTQFANPVNSGNTKPQRWEPRAAPSTRSRGGSRTRPASRADHSARILLGHSPLWELLSSEDHSLLCTLPHPHGSLFVWFEEQLHSHGPLAWGALRDELTRHDAPEVEDLALRVMADPTVASAASVQEDSSKEALSELRDLLNRMLVDHIMVQETQAIEASAGDPAALSRYLELRERRLQLQKKLERS